jgi:hypothetical protein
MPLSFTCTLCSKSYSRVTDYEAHLSSYDHTHRVRLRDMKAMSKDPSAQQRAQKAEARANARDGAGLITIKPLGFGGGSTSGVSGGAPAGAGVKLGGGFKKGGFKSAFGGSTVVKDGGKKAEDETVRNVAEVEAQGVDKAEEADMEVDEEDDENFGFHYYDPERPTGCDGRCGASTGINPLAS